MKTTTTPTNMSKANFPWSSSRRIQDEPNPQKTEENRAKQGSFKDINSSTDTKLEESKSLVSRRRKKLQQIAVSRIRSVLTALHINKASSSSSGFHHLGSCPKIVGTLFGYRKGHVHFVFQRDHNSTPVFFIELATPITSLVNEMAFGLVRIALECDKQESSVDDNNNNNNNNSSSKKAKRKRLLEEQIWRTYCNGKKCGFATKREIGPNEAKILKAVEPISMGAGVLPGFNGSGSGTDGELMYMRAQFERVVGSRDSEAFYMVNPDCHGAPELSIYLLRV
ncbi:protein MIZU-KUSSEI 1 [Silene latifolia]|uniref:protein MIZU-KUSSEI 1 n=1 Tax=Silene latifolia TaxID=37657 RepID=UPI003D781709